MVGRSLVFNLNKVNRLALSRCISTSKKNKDGHVSLTPENLKTPIPDFSKPHENKHWISYGVSTKDRIEDRHLFNYTFFIGWTGLLLGGAFLLAYYPDMSLSEWSQREAFIVLRERELAGLDPIDPWYVDPATVELPTDEELGDTEIII